MKAVILAGGSGSRLFPLSREEYPKQMLRLLDNETLFEKTLKRTLNFGSLSEIVVTTNKALHRAISIISKKYADNITVLDEPCQRNTAPSIGFAVSHFLSKDSDLNDVVVVMPSDHIIFPEDKFNYYLEKAKIAAKEGFIVTFGVYPDKPETGYGYVEFLQTGEKDFFEVLNFHEKPDKEKAIEYIKKGNFLFNSGIFVFSIKTVLEEFRKYNKEIYSFIGKGFEFLKKNFCKLPNISFDYAIMEHTKRAVVIPLKDVIWSDIGSWDKVYEILNKDEKNNAVKAEFFNFNSKNCLVYSDYKPIIGVDVEDINIIDTRDVLMVVKRGSSQKVKDVFAKLKEKKPEILKESPVEYRNWGFYEILDKNENYKVKKILLNPKSSISLQRHRYRSEHWIVVKGQVKVIIDGREKIVNENEYIHIPKFSKHKLINDTLTTAEVIEVQIGEYVGEDDIERFE